MVCSYAHLSDCMANRLAASRLLIQGFVSARYKPSRFRTPRSCQARVSSKQAVELTAADPSQSVRHAMSYFMQQARHVQKQSQHEPKHTSTQATSSARNSSTESRTLSPPHNHPSQQRSESSSQHAEGLPRGSAPGNSALPPTKKVADKWVHQDSSIA